MLGCIQGYMAMACQKGLISADNGGLAHILKLVLSLLAI